MIKYSYLLMKSGLLVVIMALAITAPFYSIAQTTFSNTASTNVPASGSSGNASVYPHSITVSGITGYITNVTVTITGINHTRPADFDIVLQSPTGVNVILMSDNNGTTGYSSARTFTFDDAAAAALSNTAANANGTYKPSNNDVATDNWTTPGPGALSQASPSLASFNNASPLGAWKLFARDDQNSKTGDISGGWSITITTACNISATANNNGPHCFGPDLNLTSTGGTVFAWTGPGGFTSAIQNPIIPTAPTTATGTYTVTATDIYGCTALATTNVTIYDKPVLSLLSQQNVSCYSGNDGIATLSTSGGVPSYTYTNGTTSNGTGVFTGNNAGTYSMIVMDIHNCSDTIAVTITEPGVPTIANAGADQQLCNLTSTTLAGNTPSYGTGMWTLMSGTAVIDDPAAATSTLSSMSTGIIKLRWTITPGPCPPSFDDVTIYNAGSIPADPDSIYGTDHACPPQNGEVFYANSVPDAVSYQWFVGPTTNGVTFMTPTTDTIVTIDFATTTNSGYSIRVLASNGCGSSLHAGLFVRRTVSTPQIAGPSTLCAGESGTYNIPAPIQGAVSYTWTVPAGVLVNGSAGPFTSTNMNVNVTLPPVFTTGNVCVAATGPCGLLTTQRCITVRTTPARPSKMNGPFQACPGSVKVYSTTAVNGAVTYNWTVPANSSIVSGQGTQAIQLAFNGSFTGGPISVSVSNDCTTGTALTKIITIAIPDVPSNIAGVSSGMCGQTSANFSVTADPTCTYNWILPAGGVILSGSGTCSITTDLSGITFPSASNQYIPVCVTRTNVCGTSEPRCMNIQGVPGKAASISGPVSVCQNQTGVTYSIAPLTGATSYTWIAPEGSAVVNGQGTTTATVNFGTVAGKVGVSGINACGHGGTKTVSVSISCRQAMTIGSSEVHVYPNPVSETLFMEIPDVQENATINIRIVDLTGREIISKEIPLQTGAEYFMMDMGTLENGPYLMYWSTGESSGSTSLIKM